MSDLKKVLLFNDREYFVFLLFFICWFFPFDLTYQNVRNVKTSLKVNVKRNAPPLIAFIDESISPSFKVRETQPSASLFQKRNPVIFADTFHKVPSRRIVHIKKPLLLSSKTIETKSIDTKSFKRSFKTTPLKVLRLKGITLSSVELPKLPSREELKNDTIISQAQTLEQVVEDTIKPITSTFTDRLSEFEKRWFAYIQEMEEESNKTSPDINEQDSSIVDARNSMPEQKWVGNIWVGLPNQQPSSKPLIISQNTNTTSGKAISDFNKEVPSREFLIEDTRMISASGMVDSTDGNNLQERLMNLSPIRIIGDVTLLSGLGLVDGNKLNVEYVNSCSFVREADIDLRKGRFSIDVEEPSSGILRAQLRDENGLLRGSGQVSLRKFFKDRFLEDSRVVFSDTAEVNLQVMPFNHSSSMKVFEVGDRRKPLKEAFVEIEGIGNTTKSDNQGLVSIPEMLIGSSFIARVHTEDLFKTLFLSTNDMTYDWETPEKTLVTSLQKHVSNLNLDLGIIWGRVLKDGNPLEGVSLELAESQNGPYYLTEDNQFVAGNATTSTGYFAYVNVSPGIQLLRGHSEEFTVPSKVLWADSGYISSVKLEQTLRKETEFCVFDNKTGDLLSARVNYLGSDIEEMETQSGRLNFSTFGGVEYFEVRPNDNLYHPTVLTSDRNEDVIAFPVPSRAWINGLAGKHKITQHPGLSVVVGHVSNSSFRAYLGNDHIEIVYFDFDRGISSQNPLPDLERGGFVLFNVEPGLQSVILEPVYSEQVAIKTVITDREFVSVFSHDF